MRIDPPIEKLSRGIKAHPSVEKAEWSNHTRISQNLHNIHSNCAKLYYCTINSVGDIPNNAGLKINFAQHFFWPLPNHSKMNSLPRIQTLMEWMLWLFLGNKGLPVTMPQSKFAYLLRCSRGGGGALWSPPTALWYPAHIRLIVRARFN